MTEVDRSEVERIMRDHNIEEATAVRIAEAVAEMNRHKAARAEQAGA